MKSCPRCATTNPDDARFCMHCGQALPLSVPERDAMPRARGGFGVFSLSLAGSLLLSFVLIYVFKLPVFLLFGFLPLLWWRRKD